MFRPVLTSTSMRTCGADDADDGFRNAGNEKRVHTDEPKNSSLTPQEALIYAMVTVAAVDRTLSEGELQRINTMIRELPAFRGVEGEWLIREAQDCGKLLAKPDGVLKVVRLIVEALPAGLRETAYALAAEIAASDLAIKDDQRKFLELLAEGLGLDDLVCAALERSAQARHRAV